MQEESALDVQSSIEESALYVQSTPRKVHSVHSKVLDQSINVQINTKQGPRVPALPHPAVDFHPEAERDRREASSSEQSALTALSKESALSAQSSIVVSPALYYYSDTREWGANPDIGRGLTDAEIAEKDTLNKNHIRPN